MSDKVIVTNGSRLRKKYGSNSTTTGTIAKALKALVAADKKRGIKTTVVFMDDSVQMKKLNAPQVTSHKNAKQNKQAIDTIYSKLQPDYLMILGASDIVPHQPLKNTTPDDGDPKAYSDLPYACSSPYSNEPSNFRSPTRVVGRLPDLVGSSDDGYLDGLLDTATTYKSRSASEFKDYLGITAKVWEDSTSLSVQNTFGTDSSLQKSPTKGPKWTDAQFKNRSHFINCHGSEADPHFYGQKGSNYPIAHSASLLAGKIANGNVTSAECCYGAELYDPSLSGGQAGICNTYLEHGAYGFFGSTTIAYGPASGNGAADLMTQYFLIEVLTGASLGRAALIARQKFVGGASTLNPVDLKTLAQFYLLGDPSIHPVIATQTHSESNDLNLLKGISEKVQAFGLHRTNRRKQLILRGKALWDSVAYSKLSKAINPGGAVNRALQQIAKNLKLKKFEINSFNILGGVVPKSEFAKAKVKRVYHLLEGELSKSAKAPFIPRVVVVAEEQNGKIVSIREYERK